jgi:O-acetyl-ADP-ribose deacetylase (regulator of RNase III)
MKAKVNKVEIQVVEGDLFALPVEALVTVTDSNLTLEPGLARRGGEELQRACQEIGWCRVGSAVVTRAGELPFERIIHAVGPRWGEGSERGKLVTLVFRCLQLSEEHSLKSVAFPPISIGAMGFPLESCARIMLSEMIDFTFEDLRYLRKVMICVQGSMALNVFNNEFARLIGQLQASGEGKVRAWSGV